MNDWQKRKNRLQARGRREQASKAGKARAVVLSPARRKAIAEKAAAARWGRKRKRAPKAEAPTNGGSDG